MSFRFLLFWEYLGCKISLICLITWLAIAIYSPLTVGRAAGTGKGPKLVIPKVTGQTAIVDKAKLLALLYGADGADFEGSRDNLYICLAAMVDEPSVRHCDEPLVAWRIGVWVWDGAGGDAGIGLEDEGVGANVIRNQVIAIDNWTLKLGNNRTSLQILPSGWEGGVSELGRGVVIVVEEV